METQGGGGDLSTPQAVRSWLSQNHPKQLSLLDKFEMELRLGRLSASRPRHGSNSSNSANETYGGIAGHDRRQVTFLTLELLVRLIGVTKWKNAAQLLIFLRGLGRELHAVGGFREPCIGNIIRRVMCACREEVITMVTTTEEGKDNKGENEDSMERIDENFVKSFNVGMSLKKRNNTTSSAAGGLSLASILWAHPQHYIKRSSSNVNNSKLRSNSFSSVDSNSHNNSDKVVDYSFPPAYFVHYPHFRPAVMEAMKEIMLDLEDTYKNIDNQATSHIHAGEVILVYGRSKTVESFLKAAAKKRQFQVIVCESAPHFAGHIMAKSLADSGIDTTVIYDSATFATMARVNKVLMPAHAVLANGGLIAPSGSHMVALAAAQNSVPVVSITGMFKLCPLFPHEGQDTLQDLVSPSSVVDRIELNNEVMDQVEFINPVHDYIPPHLINLFVTNIGAFQPSYVYRLLAEYYHSDDWETFE